MFVPWRRTILAEREIESFGSRFKQKHTKTITDGPN